MQVCMLTSSHNGAPQYGADRKRVIPYGVGSAFCETLLGQSNALVPTLLWAPNIKPRASPPCYQGVSNIINACVKATLHLKPLIVVKSQDIITKMVLGSPAHVRIPPQDPTAP